MYSMPTNPTQTTVAAGGFGTSCAPLSHHQERAALQQQLQELYCMSVPPTPETQEKIVALQEKLQALQQHETNDQCNGGPQCILQTPMFTAAVVDSPQVNTLLIID
jgi:chromodomain-helicase-DNA-binding protein 7